MKKKMMALLVTGLLLVFLVFPAGAEQGDMEIFTGAFWKAQENMPKGLDLIRDLAYKDGIFYAMYHNDVIYAWDPMDMKVYPYCSLPPTPKWKKEWRTESSNEMSFDAIADEDRKMLSGCVSYLFVGDDALWGYNAYSGRVGKITEQGIVWADQVMDNSLLFSGESIFLQGAPMYGFVESGKLFMLAEIDGQENTLLRFDLSDGRCEQLATKNAVTCCYYKPGSLLLLRNVGGVSMVFSVMDIATGAIDDLPFDIPFPDTSNIGVEGVGGLTYDPQKDVIYFAAERQVWQLGEGHPLEPVAKLDTSIYYSWLAWIMEDGRYAINAGSQLFIREIQ